MKIKKIVFTSKGQVEIEESTLKEGLQPTEVLIQTACSMVSPGTELAALRGIHSKSGLENPPDWLRYPSVPGYLVCGEIVDKGPGVENFNVGDRVLGEGPGVWNSHCSHLVMESTDYRVVPIAPSVSFEEAVTTKMGSIAMTGLRVLHPEFGDSIVVMGLGVVGQVAARLCLLAGAGQVVGVDPLSMRREIASQVKGIAAMAPDDPILGQAEAPGDQLAGFDHAIEASGHPDAFHQACRITRIRGKIAVLSSPHKTMEIRLYDYIHSRGLQILGAHGAILPRQASIYGRWTDGSQRRFFMRLLEEKRVDVLPLFSHKVDYTQAPEVYRGLIENPGEYLGVIFNWNGYGERGDRGGKA
ncbi:MAG: zinc-binding dehydrogenase [Planctomycetes bacterium]|nr:zinc-binding dehydrogenase [Planctomycetota bacterium]